MAKPSILPTQERLKEILNYDTKTGILAWKYRRDVPPQWNTKNAGKITGCKNSNGYLLVNVDGKLHLAHRLIWMWVTGIQPKTYIDHIDRIKTNNKFSNLREATHYQNCVNRGPQSNNTTGYKGVRKHYNKWQAGITVKGKFISLGTYNTPEFAHEAYKKAEKEHFGDYARKETVSLFR
jgi:hypothetical protein